MLRKGVRVRRGRSGEEGCLGAGDHGVGGPVSIPLARAQQGAHRDATAHSARLDLEAESQTFTSETCSLKKTKAGGDQSSRARSNSQVPAAGKLAN